MINASMQQPLCSMFTFTAIIQLKHISKSQPAWPQRILGHITSQQTPRSAWGSNTAQALSGHRDAKRCSMVSSKCKKHWMPQGPDVSDLMWMYAPSQGFQVISFKMSPKSGCDPQTMEWSPSPCKNGPLLFKLLNFILQCIFFSVVFSQDQNWLAFVLSLIISFVCFQMVFFKGYLVDIICVCVCVY